MSGPGETGRVVLKGIDVAQLRANAIGERETVRRRTVMVRGGETRQMQPPRTARRQHNGPGTHQTKASKLQIVENRADAAPSLVR